MVGVCLGAIQKSDRSQIVDFPSFFRGFPGGPMGMDGEQWVAVAAVVFREGRMLALRRSATKDAGPGLWETVSGRVKPGEEPLEAIRREIVEETGLEVVLSERPVDAYAARRGDRPMTVILYRAEHVDGEVVRCDEHDDHGWMTPEEFARTTTLTRLAEAVLRASRVAP